MSRRRTAILGASVLALAGAGWLAWRTLQIPAGSARAVASARVAVGASTPAPAASQPTPRERLKAAEAELPAPASKGCSLRLVEWSGRVASGASEVEQGDKLKHAPGYDVFRAGITRIDDTLRSSPDPYARAVAVWLNMPRREDEEAAVSRDERTRLLAAMAVSTDDPRIYALAYPYCSGSTDNGCHALSARRWGELDVGNAVPWLYALNEAAAAGDESGQQEAWFHIAQSQRLDDRLFAHIAVIADARDRVGGDAAIAYVLNNMSIGTAAAQYFPFGTAHEQCRRRASTDANLAQLCSRLADLEFENTDDFNMRQVGAALTRRLTGDASRVDEARADVKVWLAPFLSDQVNTCSELRQRTHWTEDMARHGMHATLRAMRGATPASEADGPTPPAPSRTPARTADPASSRS